MSEKLIQCRNLTKSYHKGDILVTPIENLELELEKGGFLALMGPSGSGKTTLLNLIAGIDSPSAGEILVAGKNIAGMSSGELTRWRRTHVGYIFQLYHLIPVLTAFENVELPLLLAKLTKKERESRVMTALELVGLTDRISHFPRQLSGGQEQRVAIARAIVSDPVIIVADEPTGDLDAQAAAQILALLRRLRDELGKTIVMVTHDINAAAKADQIMHLEKGRLIEQVKHGVAAKC